MKSVNRLGWGRRGGGEVSWKENLETRQKKKIANAKGKGGKSRLFTEKGPFMGQPLKGGEEKKVPRKEQGPQKRRAGPDLQQKEKGEIRKNDAANKKKKKEDEGHCTATKKRKENYQAYQSKRGQRKQKKTPSSSKKKKTTVLNPAKGGGRGLCLEGPQPPPEMRGGKEVGVEKGNKIPQKENSSKRNQRRGKLGSPGKKKAH